jgi:hypothetical protein
MTSYRTPRLRRRNPLDRKVPGVLIQLRQWALSRPLCGRCVVLATKRGLEVPAA